MKDEIIRYADLQYGTRHLKKWKQYITFDFTKDSIHVRSLIHLILISHLKHTANVTDSFFMYNNFKELSLMLQIY